MNLENTLDKLHSAAVKNIWLQFFTVFTRIFLAAGFIPPSIVKIMGKPFTVLPDSNSVGHYFNAIYQTGFYYEFIGWGQFFAALLLLFPRTAHLGAVLFLPIILNIAVLINSVGFAGTKYITALMFLACFYLVCWDYDRLKPLFFSKRAGKTQQPKLAFLWLPCLFALVGAAIATFFAYVKVAGIHQEFGLFLPFMTIGGFVFGLICSLHHKFMKIGCLDYPRFRFERFFLPLTKSEKKL
jgi:hypothetical protein